MITIFSSRTQLHIISLIEELGLQIYPQFTDGKKFQKLGGDEVKTYFSDIPPLPLISLIDLDLFMKKVCQPYNANILKKSNGQWDALTSQTYIVMIKCDRHLGLDVHTDGRRTNRRGQRDTAHIE